VLCFTPFFDVYCLKAKKIQTDGPLLFEYEDSELKLSNCDVDASNLTSYLMYARNDSVGKVPKITFKDCNITGKQSHTVWGNGAQILVDNTTISQGGFRAFRLSHNNSAIQAGKTIVRNSRIKTTGETVNADSAVGQSMFTTGFDDQKISLQGINLFESAANAGNTITAPAGYTIVNNGTVYTNKAIGVSSAGGIGTVTADASISIS
jgi:hypothetical protein